MRIAYLEDDEVQSAVMKEWLETEGYVCRVFNDAEVFMHELRYETYDLLIMDWELPGKSGVDLLSWLRGEREWELQKSTDDYLAKPVNRDAMLARFKALVRRHSNHRETIRIADFSLHKNKKLLTINDVPINMTEKEFQLAWMLFNNVGRLLSRDHLLESVWGFGPGLMTRTVDTHISRLRRKLGLTPDKGWRLKAVYHQGYRLELMEDEV
ncbi:MAG: response regulator transcription factor [Candidatus Thiodiazotropha sp.]